MKKMFLYLIAVTVCALIGSGFLQAGEEAPSSAPAKQKVFSNDGEAIGMLLDALKTSSDEKLIELFGAENRDLLMSKDKVRDASIRKELYLLATEKLVKEHKGNDKIVFFLGKIKWPFPFPLVKEAAGWRFDSAAGREELLTMEIGKNELNAIACCRLYVKAQNEYADKDRDTDDVIEYAGKLESSRGKKDGLYWLTDPSKKEELSPLGPALAESEKYLANSRESDPYYGYYFKILTRQGAQAPGGAYDYTINGNLVAGYALIAYPSEYGTSGIQTFIVNQLGKVYHKNLGKDTMKIAGEIKEYNPDKTWKLVHEKGMLATD
ncbi:MAG: DUF2950 domain-containing protein [Candidatus Eremiobacteraeota bacterium]|nr:DUF2950 domain-containing protein [Candidatus Eremiobacteraeota bacterium]